MLQQIVPLKVKQKVKSHFVATNINGDIATSKQKVFIGLAADYGNLGDVAISYAQYQFLQAVFPNAEIIDVPISGTHQNIRLIKKHIKSNDIITLVGGGNLTNKYQDIENFRLIWLQHFPDNRIISFPQTIDFSDDAKGIKSQSESFAHYNQHQDCTLFAREKISYRALQELTNNQAKLCPDIVLSLDQSQPTDDANKREFITTCIRDDDESILTAADKSNLFSSLNLQSHYQMKITDTHIGVSQLSWQQRIDELEKIWQQFRDSKLVITDRLHGMIFSVITKTPCIVLLNSNHKIEQTYENWLSSLDHIKLVRNFNLDEVLALVSELSRLPKEDIQLPTLKENYQPLVDALTKPFNSKENADTDNDQ